MGNCGEKEDVIREEVQRENSTTTTTNNNSLKLSLIGDSGVGKSAILLRVIYNRWEENKEATIGAAFAEKKIYTNDGKMINLNLWDTAGQERFRSLAPLYLRGCSGVVLVYSVDSRNSFDAVEKTWLPICENAYGENFPPIFLIANKMDLPENEHQVTQEMGQQLAKKNNFIFIPFSALEGVGGDKLIVEISKKSLAFSVKMRELMEAEGK